MGLISKNEITGNANKGSWEKRNGTTNKGRNMMETRNRR
jgi:hypothetical protein